MTTSGKPAREQLAPITERFKKRFDSKKRILSFDEYLARYFAA